MFRRCGVVAVAILAAASSMLVRPAGAEESEWTFSGRSGGEFEAFGISTPDPPIGEAQLEHYAGVLGMDEVQLELARELHREFADEYLRAWLVMAEANADGRHLGMATQRWGGFQRDSAERIAAFREANGRRAESFLADVRLLLHESQEARWDRLERDRRREAFLSKLATEGRRTVDLIALVRAMGLSEAEQAELAPLLEQYGVQMDHLLAPYAVKADRLDGLVDEHGAAQFAMMALTEAGAADPEAMAEAQPKIAALQERTAAVSGDIVKAALALDRDARRLVELHRSFVDRVGEALPGRVREEFDRATSKPVAAQSPFMPFSRYKQAVATLENIEQLAGVMQSQLQAVSNDSSELLGFFTLMKSVEPLSREQVEAIEEITADYERRIAALDGASADAAGSTPDGARSVISVPTARGTVNLMRIGADPRTMAAWMGGGAGSDPEAATARAEVNQAAIDRLREELTFYQRAVICQF